MTTEVHEDRKELTLALENDKARLREALESLKSAARGEVELVKEKLSLRQRIVASPYPYLIGGFALGFWLAVRR